MNKLKWAVALAALVIFVAVDWRIGTGVYLAMWANNMGNGGL